MASEFVLVNCCVEASVYEKRRRLGLHLRFKHDNIRLIVIEVVSADFYILPRLEELYIIVVCSEKGSIQSITFDKPTCINRMAVFDVKSSLHLRHVYFITTSIATIKPCRLINTVTELLS